MEIAMIFQMKIYIYTFYRRFGNFCCNVVPASTPPVTKTLTFLARSCILRLQNFHHRFLKKTFENMQINRKNIFLIFLLCGAFILHTKKQPCIIALDSVSPKSNKITKKDQNYQFSKGTPWSLGTGKPK